jgi:nucleotide-binding universal stress UspA family protein
MIKSIFVPASGSSTDTAVFATALAAARPLRAHLDFYHVRIPTAEAAARTPHFDFCVGSALPKALEYVETREEQLAANAAEHFKSFCAEHGIDLCESPETSDTVSARWREDENGTAHQLASYARHSDLIVVGRPRHADYMPTMLMEDLLVGCGRPILIAPDSPPKTLTGSIVVGWKETPESARALGAAYPLLEKAQQVVLLNVAEADSDNSSTPKSLAHLAQQLKWHGITAEPRFIPNRSKEQLADQLTRVAAELSADLLVVGGFGHSRLRELIFGGMTQSLLEYAELPVFMMR